ncbi:atp-dependent RNA helicase dbpa [Anaeramoeba flamelloides]|uniref:Atp-dependent RNA helicase dbpa n=1 Tax=Anaeramoeba flamelloides TaxID=1746091 RepID=A0AAV8A045_9EUKA|nr:atp-dependent RNA helicase dbpa [Anaeramoeba flamelloides]
MDKYLTEGNIHFGSLLLKPNLLKGLKENGYVETSDVQFKSLPFILGGLDLIVQSKAGTGKTQAFVIAVLELLDTLLDHVQVLIVTPTGELASQIERVLYSLGKHIEKLNVLLFTTGISNKMLIPKIKEGCQIVVGTPGKIKQLINIGILNINSLRLLIFDEADKLINEPTLRKDVLWISEVLPTRKQSLAFSATFPDEMINLMSIMMRDCRKIRLDSEYLSPENISQYYITVHHERQKKGKLIDILENIHFHQCFIFVNTRKSVQIVSDLLKRYGFDPGIISSTVSTQDRKKLLDKMHNFKVRIVVGTDIISRGIDITHLSLVINYDFPRDYQTYCHRIGRTGRFGRFGISVTILTKIEKMKFQKLHNNIKIKEIQNFEKIPLLEKDNLLEEIVKRFIEKRKNKLDQMKINQEKKNQEKKTKNRKKRRRRNRKKHNKNHNQNQNQKENKSKKHNTYQNQNQNQNPNKTPIPNQNQNQYGKNQNQN